MDKEGIMKLIDISTLKKEYELFRSSEKYSNRKKQSKFIELASLIIKNVLLKNETTNGDLTCLIQLLGNGCKENNFIKYLKQLNFDKNTEELIFSKFKTLGLTGYIGRAKNKIYGLSESNLKAVRNLLKSVSDANNVNEIKNAIKEFESHNIPIVKKSTYSPWLYYLKPKTCPITNNLPKKFLKKLGWDGDYITAIDFLSTINEIINETDFGFIDQFINVWETEEKIESLLKIKTENEPSVEECKKAFLKMNITDRELKILDFNYSKGTVTASEVAEKMNYANYNAANLNYGKLADKFYGSLERKDKYANLIKEVNLGILVNFKKTKEWEWTLKDNIKQALIEFGWVKKNQKTMLNSKNTILYGPPGTGKTYKTKKYAVEVIENGRINQ
jgi:hypothetical protein